MIFDFASSVHFKEMKKHLVQTGHVVPHIFQCSSFFLPLWWCLRFFSWKFHLSGEFLFKSCLCHVVARESEAKIREEQEWSRIVKNTNPFWQIVQGWKQCLVFDPHWENSAEPFRTCLLGLQRLRWRQLEKTTWPALRDMLLVHCCNAQEQTRMPPIFFLPGHFLVGELWH